jgi:hypothetical protein
MDDVGWGFGNRMTASTWLSQRDFPELCGNLIEIPASETKPPYGSSSDLGIRRSPTQSSTLNQVQSALVLLVLVDAQCCIGGLSPGISFRFLRPSMF